MLLTAEVRWFVRGPLDAEMLAWFTGPVAVASATREDRYLVFPGCDSVGVKVREGRFEVKALQSRGDTVHLGRGAAGRVERWVKWTAGAGLDWRELTEGADADRWITVRKERWLRWFRMEQGGPREIATPSADGSGCAAELTRLRVGGRPWWSVAFEAAGQADQVDTSLVTVARAFLTDAGAPGVPLTVDGSFSYPGWLATFVPPAAG